LDRSPITDDAVGEGGHQTFNRTVDPGVQIIFGLVAQDFMEAVNDIPGFDKVWQTFFNGCNRHRLGLGQVAPFKRHQADDRTGGRRIAETAFGLFSTPMPRCPFGDNPQAAVEASQSKLPP